jgi:hypothetical protein
MPGVLLHGRFSHRNTFESTYARQVPWDIGG